MAHFQWPSSYYDYHHDTQKSVDLTLPKLSETVTFSWGVPISQILMASGSYRSARYMHL